MMNKCRDISVALLQSASQCQQAGMTKENVTVLCNDQRCGNPPFLTRRRHRPGKLPRGVAMVPRH